MVDNGQHVCIDKFEWPNKRGEKPFTTASGIVENGKPGYDAEALCASVGKRICLRKEWMAGCKGPNNSPYPYGDKPDDNACNTNKLWIPVDKDRVAVRDSQHLEQINQSEPAGSRETCVSASGAYDMVGNAEEWVKCNDGLYGWCMVGGYWVNKKTPSCNFRIITHAPNWHYYEIGFRCCKDEENEKI